MRRPVSRCSSRIRSGLVVVVLATGLSCAPAQHTVEPYRSDPQSAARLAWRAERSCQTAPGAPLAEAVPTREFVTDGCSMWPDAESTTTCCVEHDIAYWCGGSAERRREADRVFGICVARRSGSDLLGGLMRAGVRVGGHPIFPMPWRWGYGAAYLGRYPRETRAPDAFAR